MTDAFDVAKELYDVEGVEGVRASQRRVTVVVCPDDPHVEQIPEDVHEAIMALTADTLWKPEYADAGRDAEFHSWRGGINHDPITRGAKQPEDYELQYHLVE